MNSTNSPEKSSLISGLTVALIPALAIFVFIKSLQNGFAFDDLIHIVQNPEIRSLDGWMRFFFQPVFPGDLYRPIPTLSYALNFAIHDLNPFGYHIVNILLHALNSILIYLFIKKLFSEKLALPTALLFAAHPIHTEVVANVIGRSELLCTAFSLLCLMLVSTPGKVLHSIPIRMALAILCFFAALFSKESGMSLLFLVPMVIAFSSTEEKKQNSVFIPFLLFFGLAAMFYAMLRVRAIGFESVLGAQIPFLDNPLTSLETGERVLFAFSLLGRYALLTIFPYELRADYSFNQIPLEFPDALFFPGMATSVFLLFFALTSRFKGTPLAFLSRWYLLGFVFTANIFFPIGTIFAERLSYLPGIGIIGMLVYLISLLSFTPLRILMIILFALLFSFRTVTENTYWKNNIRLHSEQISRSPYSAKAHLNFAIAMKDRRLVDEALIHANKALYIYPEYTHAMWAKAEIYNLQQKPQMAAYWYQKALSLDKNHIESKNGLGRLFMNSGNLEEASRWFKKSLLQNPANFDAKLGILAVEANSGNLKKASRIRDELMERDSRHSELTRVSRLLDRLILKNKQKQREADLDLFEY